MIFGVLVVVEWWSCGWGLVWVLFMCSFVLFFICVLDFGVGGFWVWRV